MISARKLPGKLPEEKIIKVVRRDMFVLLKKTLFFIFLFVLPAGLFYFFQNFGIVDVATSIIIYSVVVLGASFYFLFIWLFFFFSFIDYYLDVWIITNERIIDIHQEGFFSRTISEQRLYRVQDVTSEVHGFFSTFLNFGDLYIQTAGQKQRFLFREISHPDEIRELIIKLSERSKILHKKE